MKNYLIELMNELDFDKEAQDSLLADFAKIEANEQAKAEFYECIASYEANINTDYGVLLTNAEKAGEKVGVHKYSAGLLVFMCMSKHLKECYKKEGIDLQIWHDSMLDLKWKLWECKAVKGMWGSFVAWWFPGFFNMTRFALGRLQFDFAKYGNTYSDEEFDLKPDTMIIGVHIPRTMTPFDKASREDAYAKAKAFFAPKLNGAPMIFTCYSWLLYPAYRDIIPEKSNTRSFMDDFKIIGQYDDKEGQYNDAWRLFDMDQPEDINDYPENTSLRRAIKQYLLNGGRTGEGLGIFKMEY
ncbi:MAG: hypothetical protein IJF11_00010 [Clostridia bacterium]|nr:hypothetical protein [Clostridia bacterium]